MNPLKDRQISPVLEATVLEIYKYWINQEEDGVKMPVAPVLREVMELCGLASTSAIAYRLDRLRDLGIVQKASLRHRGIRLTSGKGWEVALQLYDEWINR